MNATPTASQKTEPSPDVIAAILREVDEVRQEVANLTEEEGAELEASAKAVSKNGRQVLCAGH